MIPKIIHYCWFGYGEKPKLAKKCIDSWKRFCPDYKIIEWNENNFGVNMNAYTKMCYEQKKYAFLSDYVRLIVVNEHGGIYFDTDVEVVKSFDDLLTKKMFIGFETDKYINTGQGFGAEANTDILKQMITEYEVVLDGNGSIIGCPILNTKALVKYGMCTNGKKQNINGISVYPIDFFNPYDDSTGILHKTQNTYSIHWYGKSWMSKKSVIRNRVSRVLHRISGKKSRYKK